MCFNAGKVDRIVRVVAGLGLIAYGIVTANMIVAGIGAIPLLTGLVGFCPFYPMLKINTGCKK
ncbi:YgaP family membrane protein [Candidatus Sulfurimonas baltica]|uniref:DUF2892 domain-containing protein n=1 Tax=Candidatus Sulfurimonas baltica TaxID=2740404 RepID=A0A7S7LWC4_9BACT|nr:DUF2892 domain-containing protein [Candidatus Sulfurimonas baltica]QOY52566.1 DUF2892 domain-containing protein [Candidatus Sulfurimonas baltica]